MLADVNFLAWQKFKLTILGEIESLKSANCIVCHGAGTSEYNMY